MYAFTVTVMVCKLYNVIIVQNAGGGNFNEFSDCPSVHQSFPIQKLLKLIEC